MGSYLSHMICDTDPGVAALWLVPAVVRISYDWSLTDTWCPRIWKFPPRSPVLERATR